MKQFTLDTLRSLLLCIAIIGALTATAQDTYDNVHITPAPGAVKYLAEFELTFDGEWGLGTYRSRAITLKGPEGVLIPKIQNFSTGASYIICFEDEAVITAPGEYTLTLPEGKFALRGEDLGEMTFTYIIEDNVPGEFPAYTINPEPGTYDALDQAFIIHFDTDDDIAVRSSHVHLWSPAGYELITVSLSQEKKNVVVRAVNNVGEPVDLTRPGEYKLVFEAGSITAGNATNAEDITFVYTVAGNVPDPWAGTFDATPADGSTVESLSEISIAFAAREILISERAKPDQFPALYNDETGEVVSSCSAIANGGILNLSLNTPVSQEGKYVLIIPSSFLTIDGANPAEDITLHYTIEGTGTAFEYTYTIVPGEGDLLSNDESITITFAAEGLVSVANDIFAWGNAAPHFTNEMGAFNPNLQISAEDMGYTLTHQWDFEVDGDYTLVIPAGYFTLTNSDNETVLTKAIYVKYRVTTTGINSIINDSTTVDVYTPAGVLVRSAANADEVKALPKGIYIINGKKAMIR